MKNTKNYTRHDGVGGKSPDVMDSIGSYSVILVISIICTFTSIIVEYIYPYNIAEVRTVEKIRKHNQENISKPYDLGKTILYRIVHYFILFYCGLYLLLFRPYGTNSYIYLIFNLGLNIQWCIFNCCILSYYELINYGVDYRKISTKFHPYIYSIFRDWSDTIIDIVGVIIIINIAVILYSNVKIPTVTKILYIGLLSYSIYVCCTGNHPLLSDGSHLSNKVLKIKNEIWRISEGSDGVQTTQNLDLYPSNPDSFFMKYIA